MDDVNDRLHQSLIAAWQQYLTALEPLRPDLFRHCWHLPGNLREAEELVQETLLKAFAELSQELYTREVWDDRHVVES